MKSNKQKKLHFISLDTFIKEKSKNPIFRKAFDEELSRLRLIHEIKTLRESRKMTQAQVATKADMPQSVIARVESGNHSFSVATLSKIAQVFGSQIRLVQSSQQK